MEDGIDFTKKITLPSCKVQSHLLTFKKVNSFFTKVHCGLIANYLDYH